MDILIYNDDHDHRSSQKDFLGSIFQQTPVMQQDHTHQQQGTSSMPFQSSSRTPPIPQPVNVPLSPVSNLQNQLALNMLNNMMQIQSVGDQLAGIAAQQTQGVGSSNMQYNPQAIFVEQQFKLSQLQQLQQLQNQIFQQQIALISGQSFLPTSPPMGGPSVLSSNLSLSSMKEQTSSSASHNDTVASYAGLPTPGSSSELRPRDDAVDFVSPMILSTNSFLDSPISPRISHHSNNHHFQHSHQHNSHAQSHHFHSHAHTAPPQIAFQIQSGIPSNPTSPDFNGADVPPSTTLSSVSGMHGGEVDVDISPLTSPWLGAAGNQHQPQHHQLQSGVDSGLNLHSTQSPSFGHHSRGAVPSNLRSKRPVEGETGNDHNDQSSSNGPPSGNTFDTSEPLRKKHTLHIPSTMSGLNRPPQHQQLTLLPPPSASPVVSPTSPTSAGLNSTSHNHPSTSPPTFSNASSGLGTSSQRRVHRGSKSVNNTPLIRAQRSRMNSVTRNQANSGTNSNSNSNTGLALPSHTMGGNGGSSSLTNTPSISTMASGSNMSMMVVGDTPSPVDLDLSMPPPAPPEHANSNSNGALGSGAGASPNPNLESGSNGGVGFGDEPRLLPATPASIMKLAPLSNGHSGRSRQQKPINEVGMVGTTGKDKRGQETEKEGGEKGKGTEKEKDGKGRGLGPGGSGTSIATGRTTRRSTTAAAGATGSGLGASPGLKAILPANILDLNSPSLHLPSGSSSRIDHQNQQQQNQQQPRKTSHKAAEQKRRDSLRSTFDDLRTLLPPIPLSSEMDDGANGGSVIPGIPGAWPPRSSSLLPGSLPPRGPPKTGADGPNKGVSKLQLLICGNEYIRVLRSRVERRDEEIARLRNEVGKLRALVREMTLSGAAKGASMGGDVDMLDADPCFDLDLDLERDLDAVELQPRDGNNGDGLTGNGGTGLNTGAMTVSFSVGALGSVGEQPDEEGDIPTGD